MDARALLDARTFDDDPLVRARHRATLETALADAWVTREISARILAWAEAPGPDAIARLAVAARRASESEHRGAALDALRDALDDAWLVALVGSDLPDDGPEQLRRFCDAVAPPAAESAVARIDDATLMVLARNDRARAAACLDAIPERVRGVIAAAPLVDAWPAAHAPDLVDAAAMVCALFADVAPDAVDGLARRTVEAMHVAGYDADAFDTLARGSRGALARAAVHAMGDDLADRPTAHLADLATRDDLGDARAAAARALVERVIADGLVDEAERRLLDGIDIGADGEFEVLVTAAGGGPPSAFAALATRSLHHPEATTIAAWLEGASVFVVGSSGSGAARARLHFAEAAGGAVGARVGAGVIATAATSEPTVFERALTLVRDHHGDRWFDAWTADLAVMTKRPHRLHQLVDTIHRRLEPHIDGGLRAWIDRETWQAWAEAIEVDVPTLLTSMSMQELLQTSPRRLGQTLAAFDDDDWHASRSITRRLLGLPARDDSDAHAEALAALVFAEALERPDRLRQLVDAACTEGDPFASLAFAHAIESEVADAAILARIAARAKRLWRGDAFIRQIAHRASVDPSLDPLDLLTKLLTLATGPQGRAEVIGRLVDLSTEVERLLIDPHALRASDLTRDMADALFDLTLASGDLDAWAAIARLVGRDEEPAVLAELLDAPEHLQPRASTVLRRLDDVLVALDAQGATVRRARNLATLLRMAKGRAGDTAAVLAAMRSAPAVAGPGELDVLDLIHDETLGEHAVRTLGSIGTVVSVPRLRRLTRNPFRGRALRMAAQASIDTILDRHDPIEGALAIVDGPSGALSTTSE